MNSIYSIYFSPTDSTKKIVNLIAAEFGSFKEFDLIKNENIKSEIFSEDDICIIGVPSYGGRVPSVALDRIKNFSGNNTKTVLITVYGNRAYDDTLLELKTVAEKNGFRCIAAIAAVAEHSIMHQFASGRPDKSDKDELKSFADRIIEKINNKDCYDSTFKTINVPGNFPYRDYKGVPLKPKAGSECTGCGICSASCPVGAIPSDNPKKTDKDICISCMRCINICPSHARKLNPMMLKIASKKLEASCSSRKENELFI